MNFFILAGIILLAGSIFYTIVLITIGRAFSKETHDEDEQLRKEVMQRKFLNEN